MASIDLIRASNGSGDAVKATVTNARVISSTTIQVDATTNWPSKFIATVGDVDGTGAFVPATVTVFNGILSGGNIEITSFAPGYTDTGNTPGQVVVLKPTTAWANEVADTLAVAHNQDGTLKNNSVTADKLDFTTFKPSWQVVSTAGVVPVGPTMVRISGVITHSPSKDWCSLCTNQMKVGTTYLITHGLSENSGINNEESLTSDDTTIFRLSKGVAINGALFTATFNKTGGVWSCVYQVSVTGAASGFSGRSAFLTTSGNLGTLLASQSPTTSMVVVEVLQV